MPAHTSEVKPALPASRVDALLREAWTRQGITPSPVASDATFLRRLTLDLWGTLPSPEDRSAFEADTAADKRARQVDKMLADERFAERFAMVWTDLLLGETKVKIALDRAAFRSWLKARMTARASWDSIVRDIVSGTGTNSPGGSVKDRSLAAVAPVAEPLDSDVHGNVNYLLRHRNAVEDLTGRTSRMFLGIQIQCAQCHDHKTEAWTMGQFQSLAAAFVQTRAVPEGGRDKGEMMVFNVRDMPRARLGPKATDAQRAIAKAEPRALDGTALDGRDRRKALADWITSRQNPTFAKAFVNRVWAQLLGSGFVDPVDDFRPGNKPDLPELLDALAEGFSSSGFDVRGVIRTVCLSDAYQRSAGPPAALWASFALRPLPADVLFDAVVSAGGLGPLVEEVAGERAELVRARTRQRFVLVLDVDEDAGTHRFEGSIPHALLLSNGAVTRVATRAVEGSALLDILRKEKTDEGRLRALYERSLGRKPTTEEIAAWTRFIAEGAAAGNEPDERSRPKGKADPLAKLERRLKSRAETPRDRAFEDIFWALLNSSEMAMQH
ncbi:MAG: DUF1549 and DUF1553 domain-containing protein [Polyangiaceae bacterium]